MKNHITTLMILLPLFAFAQKENQLKYINTFIDSLSYDSSFYNAFQYKDILILIKDKQAYEEGFAKEEEYVNSWAKSGVPVESSNLFLFDQNLKGLKRAKKRGVVNLGLSNLSFATTGYVAALHEGILTLTAQGSTHKFSAIIYECTDGTHQGSPHSGTDVNDLKTKYNCTKFKTRLF